MNATPRPTATTRPFKLSCVIGRTMETRYRKATSPMHAARLLQTTTDNCRVLDAVEITDAEYTKGKTK